MYVYEYKGFCVTVCEGQRSENNFPVLFLYHGFHGPNWVTVLWWQRTSSHGAIQQAWQWILNVLNKYRQNS